MSADIAWQIIRNNSAFLKTRRNVNKRFSTERFNALGVNSQRYNGLVSARGVDVQVNKDGKSLIVSTKIARNAHLPSKSVVEHTVKAYNPRAALKKVRGITKGTKRIHIMPVQRRASQLLRSLKAVKKSRVAQEAEKKSE